MTEQEQLGNEEALIKETITYVKTENDVEVSIAQLVEDPKLLSVENGRWTVDSRKKYAICLSEEFEQAVMSCTQHNAAEWVGFIVGNDVKWTNPENNRQMHILIAERAVIIGQARTGASAEIKQEAVEKWMDSDDESAMAFKTVFAKNRWQKIGWVHSHADLGTFWSKTDTDTMKDMRGVPMLLSIVYARDGNKKIERRIRVDKNDVLLGGKYNLFKDEIDDMFVISEAKIETLDDVPIEFQEKYKEILKNTNILNTTSHAKPGVSTYSNVATFQSSWYQRQRDKAGKFIQSTLTPAREAAQLSKHTIVDGNLSEKAKEEIIEFGNFHYSLPQAGRKNLSVADFFVLLDKSMVNEMKPDGLYKKWKMKDVVKSLDKQQILTIISFYKNSEVSVQLAMKAYHNFKEFTKRFAGALNSRLEKDSLLGVAVCSIAGDDWLSQIEASLVEKESIKLDIGSVEKTVEEVVKEIKPIPFMPSETFTDWTNWYMFLPKKYKADFFDTIFDCDQEIANYKKIAERIEYAILLEMRGDEEKYLSYAVAVYENLVNMWRKTSNRYREAYRNFYTSYFLNAFQPFFSKYTYYNEKDGCSLQKFLNALDEEYVKQFINDFIVSYETDEELEEFAKKYPKDISVYKQTFKCAICDIVWIAKADAESCEEECRKRGRTTSKTVIEIEAKDATAKKEKAPQSGSKTLLTDFSGSTTMAENIPLYSGDYIFGTTVKYYEGLNVCNLCGTLYDTQESAEVCAEQCADVLEDVKTFFLDKDGMYECSFCGEQFMEDEDALRHSDTCKENGTILSYLLYMMTDSGEEPLDVVKTVYEYHLSKGGTPAPFMEWMLDKGERERNIFTCEICGVEVEQSTNTRLKLMKAYMHENFCKLESKDAIKWVGTHFNCTLCTSSNYSTTASDLMQMHLFMRHGLYPTRKQIVELSTTTAVVRSSANVLLGETVNALLMDDGLCCKECGDMYIRPDSLLNHITKKHTGIVVYGEYQQWIEHDDNIELSLYGALPDKIVEKKKLPANVLSTDNINSYNGIFVCKHCELTAGGVSEMRKHLQEAHEIEMSTDEENIMLTYLAKYLEEAKTKQVADTFDWGEGADDLYMYENLDELFEEWLEERIGTGVSKTMCESCGEMFNESDSETENIYKCFIHEVDCMKLSIFDIESFVCSVCGTLYPSILEREVCEEQHFEGGQH